MSSFALSNRYECEKSAANKDERPKNWVNEPNVAVQSPHDDACLLECKIGLLLALMIDVVGRSE